MNTINIPIKIRRNETLEFALTSKVDNGIIEKLFGGKLPEPTNEQKKMMDDAKERRIKIERKVWEMLEKKPAIDLDGNNISEDTHEIEFECEYHDENGMQVGILKTIYIQPKR